jgi:hypothetical protein
MAPKPPSPNVELMDVKAGMPFLRAGEPADSFRALRAKVIAEAGFDFLDEFGDMMRSKGFKPPPGKPGVAKKSRHQCGDAFDYNQSNPRLAVVREDVGGQTFFRTYLKCTAQDGTMGTKKTVTTFGGKKVTGFLYDFTAAAGSLGWHRIPAHKGWATKGKNYNKMEFWHYENTEGKSWDDVIKFLYPPK